MIEPDDLRLPQHLKQFALHECLGRGPQGGVYRASETGLGRVVAIKVLAPERADSHREQQFFAQAAAAARVIHPNVVQIYFVGQDGPFCFCAREYVQGESLANVLSNHSPLVWPVLVHILHQALRGLVAAHALDLTHGNLTPSNVLIDQTTGRVLLSDFGVSAELVPTASRSTLDRQGPATVKNDLCQLSHLISRLLPLTEPPSGKSNVVLDQQRLDDILSRMAENVGSNSIQSASMALQALETTGLLNPDHAPLPAPALSDANVNPGYATSVDLFRVTTLPEVPEAVFDDTEPRQGWLGRLRSLWPFRVWSHAGVAGTTESHPVTRRRWYVASQLTIALLLFLLAGYLFNEMLRKQRARRPQMSRGPLTNAEKYPHLTRFNSPSPDNRLAWIPEPLTDIPLRQLNLPYSRRINKLAALPQGSLVATVSNDASLRIWSPSTGQELQRYIYFPDHQFTSLECVACRPDGRMIAVAAGSSPARIFTWDPVSEQVQWIVTEPKAHAVSIEYQADGKHLAVLFEAPQGGLAQTYITLFDAFDGRQVERLDWDEKQIRRIACSPTAPLMACQVRSHLIRFWDSQAHTATHQFTTGGPSVTSFAFSQDGKRLAVATENDDVMLWNIATTTTEMVIKNRKGYLIKQIAWSPHEKYLAAIGNGITTVCDG